MSIRQTPLWCCCALFAGAGADTVGAAPPVTFDGSAGPRGSRSGTDMVIPASYGRIVGGNLFHSFGRFDVPQGRSEQIVLRDNGGESAAVREAGDDTVGAARNVGTLTGSAFYNDFVGVSDSVDFYTFTLDGPASFRLTSRLRSV